MSCVREASPPLSDDHLRHDMKKRRFLQPLRGLRRIFRKKGRTAVISTTADGQAAVNGFRDSNEHLDLSEQQTAVDTNLEPAKSHSTSHLDADDQTDNAHRSSLQSTTLLSVSHDSVFTSEQRSPNSGSETSLYVGRVSRLGFPNSSVRAELFEAVRSRRRAQENKDVSDDEDLGLPRSPISSSPTAADDLFTKENNVTKSSQSTCSDGSLLSMGSSEIDEDSYCHSSRHSSKISLFEKQRTNTSTGSDLQHNDRSTNSSSSVDAASLSHSAAKHKMAIKPKRNHGAPHKKRQIINNTLPTTPELNEESNPKNGVTVTPTVTVNGKDTPSKPVADSGQSDKHQLNQNHVCKTSSSSSSSSRFEHQNTSVTQITSAVAGKRHSEPPNRQSKYSSLPPLVTVSPAPSFKLLSRSKSNATSSSAAGSADDSAAAVDVKEAPKQRDDGSSFFSRLLLRRSSKKKKNAGEEADSSASRDASVNHDDDALPAAARSWPTSPDERTSSLPALQEEPISMAYVNGGLAAAMKHHPLFRQRVEPLNLSTPPPTPAPTPTCTPNVDTAYAKISFSSTVPVNMDDHTPPLSVPVNKEKLQQQQLPCVQKSHSFHQSDKLPYSVSEDTPSLPANVGLVECEDTLGIPTSTPPTIITVAEDGGLASRYTRSGNESVSAYADAGEREKFEPPVVPVMGVGALTAPLRWKSSTPPKPVPDYENLAAVSKLSISVNEGVDVGSSSSSVEVVAEAKPAVAQTPSEVKIPVPAPRTSLLNRTSSHSQLVERSTSGSSSSSCSLLNDSINVTVTESPDRQRSIISISSNDYPSVTAADLLEAVASSADTCAAVGADEDGGGKVDDLEDDVFQPDSESPPAVVPSCALPTPTREATASPAPQIEEPEEEEQQPVDTDDRKSYAAETLREESVEVVSGAKMAVEPQPLPPKPVVVVADFNAGIVKVNDTTVVIRKKTPQPKRDEEPELMKVFARRSLKLKETDAPEEEAYDEVGGHKSRDSDKENEDANTPLDEQPSHQQARKKKNEAPDAVIAAVPPKPTAAYHGRFQRSVSHDAEKYVLAATQTNHLNSEKRQRCKSANETEKRPDVVAAVVCEKKAVAPAPGSAPAVGGDEKPTAPFKRIQQRREEWEKRAQQAMKVHGTK